jgi:hypothetical protein
MNSNFAWRPLRPPEKRDSIASVRYANIAGPRRETVIGL